MALDGTYSGLQASVADWLNRPDLTSAIPDFIAIATAQLNRRLLAQGPVREMMANAPITVNAEFLSVPSDFAGARAIFLTGALYRLTFVEPEKLTERKATFPSEDGDPQVYTVVGSQLQFWPWAGAGSYPGTLTYWQKVPALSNSNPTNWLLTAHPDAYLYTTLLQAAPYLKDDGRVEMWGTLATQIVSDIVEADRVSRSATQMAVPIVYGGTH